MAMVFLEFFRYGDRAPLSHKGRSFAMLWTLTGLVIISLTMAMITTALTSITLQSKIKLYGSKVISDFPILDKPFM